MNSDKINEIVGQMPKAENPFPDLGDDIESWHYLFNEGAKAQAELMINGGFRQVPSVDEIADELRRSSELNISMSVALLVASRIHRWLMEGE